MPSIGILGTPFPLSEATEAKRVALVAAIQEHDEEQAALHRQAAELAVDTGEDAVAWDEAAASYARHLADHRLSLLNRTLFLRGQLAELLKDFERDKLVASTAAFHAHRRALDEIRAGMESLGFIFQFEQGEPIGALRGALLVHPRVRAAADYHGSIVAWSTGDHRRANEREIARLESELQGARARATAALTR